MKNSDSIVAPGCTMATKNAAEAYTTDTCRVILDKAIKYIYLCKICRSVVVLEGISIPDN